MSRSRRSREIRNKHFRIFLRHDNEMWYVFEILLCQCEHLVIHDRRVVVFKYNVVSFVLLDFITVDPFAAIFALTERANIEIV